MERAKNSSVGWLALMILAKFPQMFILDPADPVPVLVVVLSPFGRMVALVRIKGATRQRGLECPLFKT